jgi:hypothetical protein
MTPEPTARSRLREIVEGPIRDPACLVLTPRKAQSALWFGKPAHNDLASRRLNPRKSLNQQQA